MYQVPRLSSDQEGEPTQRGSGANGRWNGTEVFPPNHLNRSDQLQPIAGASVSRTYSLKRRTNGAIGFAVLLGVAIIAAAAYFAGSYQIVNTSGGLRAYPKASFGLNDTYVDMTKLSFGELRRHTGLVGVMSRHGDLAYVPGGRALERTARAGYEVSEAINRFDNDYQVTSSLHEAGRIGAEKYRALDEKYHLDEKAATAREVTKRKAQQLNRWLKQR